MRRQARPLGSSPAPTVEGLAAPVMIAETTTQVLGVAQPGRVSP